MKVRMVVTKGSRAGRVFETTRQNARILRALGSATDAPADASPPWGDANRVRIEPEDRTEDTPPVQPDLLDPSAQEPALEQAALGAAGSARENEAMKAELAKHTNAKLRELALAEETPVDDTDVKAVLVDKIVRGRYLRRDMRAAGEP